MATWKIYKMTCNQTQMYELSNDNRTFEEKMEMFKSSSGINYDPTRTYINHNKILKLNDYSLVILEEYKGKQNQKPFNKWAKVFPHFLSSQEHSVEELANVYAVLNQLIEPQKIIARKAKEERCLVLKQEIKERQDELDELLKETTLPENVNRCCICLDKKSEFLNTACGHLCLCVDCKHNIKECPMCRVKVTSIIKVY